MGIFGEEIKMDLHERMFTGKTIVEVGASVREVAPDTPIEPIVIPAETGPEQPPIITHSAREFDEAMRGCFG